MFDVMLQVISMFVIDYSITRCVVYVEEGLVMDWIFASEIRLFLWLLWLVTEAAVEIFVFMDVW